MGSTGQRVELRVGGVAAEVALVKTSGKPKAAEHETRRVGTATEAFRAQAGLDPTPPGGLPDPPSGGHAAVYVDPMAEARDPGESPFGADEREAPPDVAAAADAEAGAEVGEPAKPPPPEFRHGVTREHDGAWVDLTDELDAIDERTRLDGMEVAYTVASSAVPRLRVRDAHFVAPADPGALGVLAHLWRGLRDGDLAALVRWTKRTNQALGAIVAAGTPATAHLVLLELEWTASMRALPPRARLAGAVEAVTPEGRLAVEALLDAMRGRPGVVAHLRDERSAQRADVLQAARDGASLPEAPEAAAGPEAEVVEALERALAEVAR